MQRGVVDFRMARSEFGRRAFRRVVADAVRETRVAIGWSQQTLADRAGLSRAQVANLETARVSASLDTTGALLDALGVRWELVLQAPFLADRRRQREPAHGLCSAYVQRRLEADGWFVRREVEVVHGRSHGWIDLLAFHPIDHRLLVIEVKTEIDDLGRIERTLAWYERMALPAARRLGWQPARVASLLVVLATEANEHRMTENRPVIEAAFGQPADELTGASPGAGAGARAFGGRGVAMVDPRSRRRRWLLVPRMMGRRSRAPYADYADFMRATRSRACRAAVSVCPAPRGRCASQAPFRDGRAWQVPKGGGSPGERCSFVRKLCLTCTARAAP
jgi:transcriptional regulator with XRE-family HTH domain